MGCKPCINSLKNANFASPPRAAASHEAAKINLFNNISIIDIVLTVAEMTIRCQLRFSLFTKRKGNTKVIR